MRAALSRASSRAATAEPLARLLQAAVALAALAAGFALASRHPLAPGFVSLAFAVCCLAAARWRDAWLWALPAALPLLNFAPWTGWTVIDEFDLLVLAAVDLEVDMLQRLEPRGVGLAEIGNGNDRRHGARR